MTAAADGPSDDIIALERGALDRWGKGDPQGFIELFAPEITYFDPTLETRIRGDAQMKAYFAPIIGKVKVDRYDMIDPAVQRHGNTALLTFNLVSYQTQADGEEKAISRWNSTEVYARLNGVWRIIHSHWSYIKPELKHAAPLG